ARPKYNGGVERGNRTFREEFYACRDLIADSIGAMRFELRKAVEKYNKFRPHHALKGRTPMEYLRINQADAARVSKDVNLYSRLLTLAGLGNRKLALGLYIGAIP
ncbi:MAG: integrase core domain-containing protein, partial [Rhodobacterales bacterium]